MATKHKTIITFRPPPDVDTILQQAQHATGCSATDLILRCIKRSLVAVVQDILLERQHAAHHLAETTLREEFKSFAQTNHIAKPKKA